MFIILPILIIIEVLCSILLIAVVLMQKTRGEGLGMAFGAEMGESLFGARATNVLTRITIWLGVIFLVNTTVLAMIHARPAGRTVLTPQVMPAVTPQPIPAPIQGLDDGTLPAVPANIPVANEPAQPEPTAAEPAPIGDMPAPAVE